VKKVEQHLQKNFKPIKLFYDDIESLYDIFREQTDEIKIEADMYELENINEILSIKKRYFTNLKFSIYKPYMSLEFSNNSIRLYTSDDTPIQRGLFEKLNSLLKKKERFPLSLLLNPILSIIPVAILGGIFFIEDITLRSIVSFITIIWLASIMLYDMKFHSMIIPIHKNSQPNFFQRNKDQIILVIISAVVGGLISTYLSKLFK